MKMYWRFLLLQLLAVHSASAQEHNKDTTFILRETGLYYHPIFIETNPASTFYTNLAANTMSRWDTSFYIEGIALLKNKVTLTKHHLQDIPRNWHPLYSYKGQFYVYYPSDGMYNNWYEINDSVFLQYAAGEMMPEAITSFRKERAGQYHLTTIDHAGEKRSITIHLVDPQKGIAVFEFSDGKGSDRYQLMVATSKIRNFPLIVNYCNDQKQDEWEFDKPDYELLLRQQASAGKDLLY